jgi:hypothetical protein
MKKTDFIPKTLNEAIDFLYKGLNKEEIGFIKKNNSGSVHFSTGMSLRNNWGFWKEGTPFKKDIKKRFKLFGHGDDCSGLVLEGVWAKVMGKDVNEILDKAATRYYKHWKRYGVNPETGKELPNFKMPQSTTIQIDKDGNIID